MRNALTIAAVHGFRSIALPSIGAGSGGFPPARAKEIMIDESGRIDLPIDVTIVVFKKP